MQSQTDANVLKLDWVGSGVTFYVSADGSTWTQLTNGQPLKLTTVSRSLTLKAVLAANTGSLERYTLQINPTGFNLFTGKMLTQETGLVYFGGRWYDPEVGRFVSVDPAEQGENWYSFCENDPINNFDPDGRLSLRGWGLLWGGLKVGFNTYAIKTAGDVASGIVIGSAIAVCMPAIMPTLPAAIPVIAAAVSYAGTAFDIADDLRFLVKEFSTVFLSKNPSDGKVHAYGVRVSKVGLDFAGLLATSQGMKAVMKTGILQKAGIWLKNTGEHGSVRFDKEWISKVKFIKEGKGKGVNTQVLTKDEAIELINQARPLLKRKPTYTEEIYKAGYEVHPAEPGVNELPHIKWKDWSQGKSVGSDGHIFFFEE